jgi:glyoxylate reductase
MKVLITYQLPKEGLQILFEKYDVFYPEKEILTEKDMLQIIHEFDAVITVFGKPFPDSVIKSGKNLKIISNYGAGVDNINLPLAVEMGILVTNTPDAVTEPTAELTLGLMLSVMRRISENDRKLRIQPPLEWGIMKNLGNTLSGKMLGIIGMGKIGRSVAGRALAFGMQICYHNRNKLDASVEKELEATRISLAELLEISDVISVHTPLTPETKHLIGETEFNQMKNGAFLINTARGPVIDENAMVKALETGKLGGAGLDVFENEPEISQELLQMDNVVLVPHIGTGTTETRINIGIAASQNIVDFFEGKTPEFVVNPTVIN